jgi:hypothetical protein
MRPLQFGETEAMQGLYGNSNLPIFPMLDGYDHVDVGVESSIYKKVLHVISYAYLV